MRPRLKEIPSIPVTPVLRLNSPCFALLRFVGGTVVIGFDRLPSVHPR